MANRTSACIHRCRCLAAAAVLGVLAATGLAAGVAQAAGYKTIHPMGFAPVSQGAATASTFFVDPHNQLLAGNGCYGAAVDLPHGSTLTRLKVEYRSFDVGDVGFMLVAAHHAKPGKSKVLIDELILDDSNRRRVPNYGLFHVVDTKKFMYALQVCLGVDGAFYGARFKYTGK